MSNATYRRPLNPAQVELLELLYKFRFGTSDLIAQYFSKSNGRFVYKRLKILQEQGYIGKRFDSSYRIRGRPAAYYLLPAGARQLQRDSDNEKINIKAIYKDSTVSEAFIDHCLNIFTIYNALYETYHENIGFFPKTSLTSYEHFPSPLPDVFISLEVEGAGTKYFFLDIFDNNKPFFTIVRRINQYISYKENGEWTTTGTIFPLILLVCESSSHQKRLQKHLATTIKAAWSDYAVFSTATIQEITQSNNRAPLPQIVTQ